MDNFRLYDPVTQIDTKKRPSELSLLGNVTRYFFNYRLGVALNGSYNFITYNKTALIGYKDISNVIQDANVVAFKKFDGKYGTLEENINGGRISVAFPIFFKSKILYWKRAPYFSPAPYYNTRITKNLKPSHNVGVSFNFFGEKPFKDDKFSIPSSIGLGIDWTRTEGVWSKANVFLAGSITLK